MNDDTENKEPNLNNICQTVNNLRDVLARRNMHLGETDFN